MTGKFTPRLREIYRLALDAQPAFDAEFKPGKARFQA